MFERHPAEQRLHLSLDNIDGQIFHFQGIEGELRPIGVLAKGGMRRRSRRAAGESRLKWASKVWVPVPSSVSTTRA